MYDSIHKTKVTYLNIIYQALRYLKTWPEKKIANPMFYLTVKRGSPTYFIHMKEKSYWQTVRFSLTMSRIVWSGRKILESRALLSRAELMRAFITIIIIGKP